MLGKTLARLNRKDEAIKFDTLSVFPIHTYTFLTLSPNTYRFLKECLAAEAKNADDKAAQAEAKTLLASLGVSA